MVAVVVAAAVAVTVAVGGVVVVAAAVAVVAVGGVVVVAAGGAATAGDTTILHIAADSVTLPLDRDRLSDGTTHSLRLLFEVVACGPRLCVGVYTVRTLLEKFPRATGECE
jgi:hypothetical protein